ncbi:MAG TPA: hypothetical protein VF593_04710 [Chthoniobacteraceae bacterium]
MRAAGDDLVGVLRLGDYPDGARADPSFVPDAAGKRDLVVFGPGDLRMRDHGGDADEKRQFIPA